MGYLPLVTSILRGENLMLAEKRPEKISMTSYIAADRMSNKNPQSSGSIAIYTVEGAITKADQFCGPEGTDALMRSMRQAEANPQIVGHLLDMNSGGGEGTNTQEVAKMIRTELQKPVVVHFNGLLCSAAYYIACAADEIYATLPTDIVGSVGCLITIADFSAALEAKGIKIHEIYATAATEKNDIFIEAFKGNYEPIKTQLLNPFNAQFHATVKKMRPETANHEAIFTGKNFLAQDATSNGLIDGFLDFNACVSRVFAIAEAKNAPKEAAKTSNSKLKKVDMKIFGIDVSTTKAENGSVTLTAEQWAELSAASAKSDTNATQMTAFMEKLDALSGDMTTIKASVEKLNDWAEATPATVAATPNPSESDNAPDYVAGANARIAARLKK